jgi:hypothetical protein
MRLENMSPRVFYPWRTGDGVTHWAWRESAELFAGSYAECEPLKLR